jgi:hypothetical protein
MRHREAWAEPQKAPSKEEYDREQAAFLLRETNKKEHGMSDESNQQPPAPGGEPSRDVLVVVSKLKAYIKAKSGMNTSDGVISVISDQIRGHCDQAAANAQRDGRKTVMDRDFQALTPTPPTWLESLFPVQSRCPVGPQSRCGQPPGCTSAHELRSCVPSVSVGPRPHRM